MTTTDRHHRPSKPHLADAIGLRDGIAVTDLHLHRTRAVDRYWLEGEGRDGQGRRFIFAGTVDAQHRPSIGDVDTVLADGDPFANLA